MDPDRFECRLQQIRGYIVSVSHGNLYLAAWGTKTCQRKTYLSRRNIGRAMPPLLL